MICYICGQEGDENTLINVTLIPKTEVAAEKIKRAISFDCRKNQSIQAVVHNQCLNREIRSKEMESISKH